MVRTWTYNGIEYQSEWEVRQEIFQRDHVCFGEVPVEGAIDFWLKYGVTYKERDHTPEEAEAIELAKAKRERAAKVASIKVTVDGMVFDGDEAAQSRMTRAIAAAETAGLKETIWVLADNTVAKVTKAQLQQALSKAMLEMGELWTTPYTGASS